MGWGGGADCNGRPVVSTADIKQTGAKRAVPPSPNVRDYEWLVGPGGAECLLAAQSDTGSLPGSPGTVRARLVAEQLQLRQRARHKFRAPDQLFFTARGLEQTTDQWIAEYKAARFSSGTVADLCSGVGGDLTALAARCSQAVLVEADPCLAVLAAANVRALAPQASLSVLTANVEELDPREFPYWHADPDRRPTGKRVSQLLHTSPDASVFERWIAAATGAALKLAPAARVPEAWADAGEREWISRDRECRQQVLWTGSLAQAVGEHRATKVFRTDSGPPEIATLAGQPGLPTERSSAIGRYVFEPDAAVLAADLLGALAAQHCLSVIAPGVAYLTGDAVLFDPLLSVFEVTDVLPLDRKKLRRLLSDRGIGTLEIKQRGAGVDPAQLRRELRLRGAENATLLVARIDRRVMAILGRRV